MCVRLDKPLCRLSLPRFCPSTAGVGAAKVPVVNNVRQIDRKRTPYVLHLTIGLLTIEEHLTCWGRCVSPFDIGNPISHSRGHIRVGTVKVSRKRMLAVVGVGCKYHYCVGAVENAAGVLTGDNAGPRTHLGPGQNAAAADE